MRNAGVAVLLMLALACCAGSSTQVGDTAPAGVSTQAGNAPPAGPPSAADQTTYVRGWTPADRMTPSDRTALASLLSASIPQTAGRRVEIIGTLRTHLRLPNVTSTVVEYNARSETACCFNSVGLAVIERDSVLWTTPLYDGFDRSPTRIPQEHGIQPGCEGGPVWDFRSPTRPSASWWQGARPRGGTGLVWGWRQTEDQATPRSYREAFVVYQWRDQKAQGFPQEGLVPILFDQFDVDRWQRPHVISFRVSWDMVEGATGWRPFFLSTVESLDLGGSDYWSPEIERRVNEEFRDPHGLKAQLWRFTWTGRSYEKKLIRDRVTGPKIPFGYEIPEFSRKRKFDPGQLKLLATLDDSNSVVRDLDGSGGPQAFSARLFGGSWNGAQVLLYQVTDLTPCWAPGFERMSEFSRRTGEAPIPRWRESARPDGGAEDRGTGAVGSHHVPRDSWSSVAGRQRSRSRQGSAAGTSVGFRARRVAAEATRAPGTRTPASAPRSLPAHPPAARTPPSHRAPDSPRGGSRSPSPGSPDPARVLAPRTRSPRSGAGSMSRDRRDRPVSAEP